MTDAVLNQILNQLQALQVSQQALQAKVRRTVDASSPVRWSNRVWLAGATRRSTILPQPAAFQTLQPPCLVFREPTPRR